ncbi:uncharacterized protein LOC136069941 [Quercus suber]|uniref:uncharacterized protein LOC136069941 n=1 Tax=Quercus suber TaxID=58331 RepID=UPI0032DF9FA7
MRESVEAIHGVDFCLTEPLLRDIGGQACNRKHRNMLKSVTNAKDLHQTFTNRRESSILFSALGRLLNGVWIFKTFKRYCCDLEITNRYSTLAYPQGNGQAEAVNKVTVNGLKKRLDNAKEKWVEELSRVIWTYQTTPRRSTGETPFSMMYGAKAVIPLETSFPKFRTSSFIPSNNDELLGKSLDLIKERRENAMVQLAYYQHKLK